MTFLQNFIDKKMREYNPPASKREGGLSEQKYKATLLFLTNRLHEDIAEEVGVSYGLLRKWRTEDTFFNTIDKHYKEFLREIVFELEKGIVESFDDIGNYNEILVECLNPFTSPELYPKPHNKFDEDLYFVARKTLYNAMLKYLPKDKFQRELRQLKDSMFFDKVGSLKADILRLNIKSDKKKEMLKKVDFLIDLKNDTNTKMNREQFEKWAKKATGMLEL